MFLVHDVENIIYEVIYDSLGKYCFGSDFYNDNNVQHTAKIYSSKYCFGSDFYK